MKRILVVLIFVVTIFLLSGCSSGDNSKLPRVELWKDSWRFDTIYLPLRNNHTFAEAPYGIEETENGYNIIIYCVEEKENE